MKEGKKTNLKKTPLWEDIAVIASIIALWPAVLFREKFFSSVIMVITLLVLIVIVVRRVKRFDALNK